jgi:hypothetical protein
MNKDCFPFIRFLYPLISTEIFTLQATIIIMIMWPTTENTVMLIAYVNKTFKMLGRLKKLLCSL